MKYGWNDSSFVIDSNLFRMASLVSNSGLWRMRWQGHTHEKLRPYKPNKAVHMLPDHPGPFKME